eukprot:jgi/Tetstr1/466401/TSEL_010930.t1
MLARFEDAGVEFTPSTWAVAYADHVARCSGGNSNHAAHEWAAHGLSDICHDVKSALGVGVQILTDPSVLVSLPKGSDGRPADVGLFGYGGIRGNTVAIDTTIAPILGVSSSDPTTALRAAERHKIQKYDEGVRNAAGMLRFVPFAVSEFGSLAPHAEAFLLGYHHAQSIVLDKDYEPLAKHFLQQTQSVLGRGVDLLFVFDGAPTPAKRSTDSARQVRRAKAYAAVQYDGAEADPKMLRAAVSLGWPAVVAVLSQLRRAGIPYIVAPFAADAQLSLLARDGKIWAAVTIDSDFIIHGLPRVFLKVSWRSGRCLLYSKAVLQDPDRRPELPSKFKPPQQLLPIVKDAGLPARLCFGAAGRL